MKFDFDVMAEKFTSKRIFDLEKRRIAGLDRLKAVGVAIHDDLPEESLQYFVERYVQANIEKDWNFAKTHVHAGIQRSNEQLWKKVN